MPYLKYSLTGTQKEKLGKNFVAESFSDRLKNLDGLISTLKTKGKLRGVLTPGISYIKLNNPFDPRSGLDLNLWAEFSGGPFLGNPPFVNIGSQNRFFLPLGPITLAFQASIMRAFINPNSDNWEEIKDNSSMDSLGGDRSIRGYKEGSIDIKSNHQAKNQIYAGYLLNTANIEIRFPITTKNNFGNFSGAVFLDQGMLIPCSNLFKCADGKSLEEIIWERGFGLSTGLALRYSLPVGPISLDFGISPITGEWRFHLLFGHAF